MRVSDWPTVLVQKVEEWRYRPFEWGVSDCCQFAADVVLALTGTDHRAAFPQYGSREEAEAIIAQHGGMVGLLSSVLGEAKPVARAMRGDVIAADFGDGIAAGICLGVHSCAPGARGLIFRPTLSAVAAWGV